MNLSQSLFNQVFFVSDEDEEVDGIHESQSLFNQVFFVSRGIKRDQNFYEVAIPF